MVLPKFEPVGRQTNSINLDGSSTTTIHNTTKITSYSPLIEFRLITQNENYRLYCDREAAIQNSITVANEIEEYNQRNDGMSEREAYIEVRSVDKLNFEIMLSFFERKIIKYNDHQQLLELMKLAEIFNCYDFGLFCIRELDLQISLNNVIDIYRAISIYKPLIMDNQISNKQSTPVVIKNELKLSFKISEHIGRLLFNVLQFIDMHATVVLRNPQIYDLSYEEIFLIAKRETLQLTTELVLFECLCEWTKAECWRRNFKINKENQLKVLSTLAKTPRYLLLTQTEFQQVCQRLQPLNEMETNLIDDLLQGRKVKNLSVELTALIEYFRTMRPHFAGMPIHMSARSDPNNYSYKMKTAAEKQLDEDTAVQKCVLGCLTFIMCLFHH